jgi:hypothetical protein
MSRRGYLDLVISERQKKPSLTLSFNRLRAAFVLS